MPNNDGGPAFPVMTYKRVGEVSMSTNECPGMTLRDYFAGQAISGAMMVKYDEQYTTADMVESAYEIADAMLKERER